MRSQGLKNKKKHKRIKNRNPVLDSLNPFVGKKSGLGDRGSEGGKVPRE